MRITMTLLIRIRHQAAPAVATVVNGNSMQYRTVKEIMLCMATGVGTVRKLEKCS